MSDWFWYESFESSQFIDETQQPSILADIQSARSEDLLNVFANMGFRATPQDPDQEITYMLDGKVWRDYVEKQAAELQQ